MRTLALPLLAVGALLGCASGDDAGSDAGPASGGDASYDGPVVKADWQTTPGGLRGQHGRHFAFQCPKNPGGEGGPVWGSDEYTDDSSVCMAGVHAGAITFQDGGLVVVEIRPGRDRYEGAAANGITSGDWDRWDGGFAVME